MNHRSFADAVLSGESLSHESFAFELTPFDRLRALFLRPFGRGYAGRYWGGMQSPRTQHGHTLLRMRELDGDHLFSYDDVEYHAPTPKKTTFGDLSARGQRIASLRFKGLKDETELLVDQPWRRLTPRVERPGHARRARLRMERVTA